MDVNEYMKQSLALQTRIAVAVEALAAGGVAIKAVSNVLEQPGNGQPAPTAQATAGTSSQPAASAASAGDAGNAGASTATQASAPPASGGSAPSGDKKAPSVDACRAALSAYAKKHGNPAAMSLLNGFDGAKSISALPEDKRADFVAKCEEGSK